MFFSNTLFLRKLYLVILCVALGHAAAFGQTYDMGSGSATDGSTITVSCGTNTEVRDPGGGGNYGNNENVSVTFCSDNGNPLYFDFENNGGNLNMNGSSPGTRSLFMMQIQGNGWPY